ncbi:hypothetical protein TRVL_06912 [Trypanosoma vivax]|nr:hypothetical protein TRVL_06912 [Trypanosoma vivax]
MGKHEAASRSRSALSSYTVVCIAVHNIAILRVLSCSLRVARGKMTFLHTVVFTTVTARVSFPAFASAAICAVSAFASLLTFTCASDSNSIYLHSSHNAPKPSALFPLASAASFSRLPRLSSRRSAQSTTALHACIACLLDE